MSDVSTCGTDLENWTTENFWLILSTKRSRSRRRSATNHAPPEPQRASLESLCEDRLRLARFGYLGSERPSTIPLSNPSVPLIS